MFKFQMSVKRHCNSCYMPGRGSSEELELGTGGLWTAMFMAVVVTWVTELL